MIGKCTEKFGILRVNKRWRLFSCQDVLNNEPFSRQTMQAVGAKMMSDIGQLYSNYDVIAVDEGQFFPDVRSHQISFSHYIDC